jgi:hypothetical protein
MKCLLRSIGLKDWVAIIVLLQVFPAISSAQHCPYDGFYAIVIQPKLLPNHPLPRFKVVQQKSMDSCAFTDQLDTLNFRSKEEWWAIAQEDKNGNWYRWLFPDLKKRGDFLQGNLVVRLSQSGRYCMVPRGNEYRFEPRQFRLIWKAGEEWKQLDIPDAFVYHLCGTAGSWQRIKPFAVEME